MNLNFITSMLGLLALAPLMALSIVPPGASTPLFNLVAVSKTSSVNLLPVRMKNALGGAATLSGTNPVAKFYFTQGVLVIDTPPGTYTYQPIIIPQMTDAGCTPGGPLWFATGSGSNLCVKSSGLKLQSNTENSQLGARLVYNYVGGFYSCGASKEIYYKVNANEPPSGCFPVDLYTVPVV